MAKQGGKIVIILLLISAGFFCTQKAKAGGSVLINEIMYNAVGSDTDNEWAEIYNTGSEAITIVEGSGTGSWRFNDGSNHTFTLVQGSLIIATGGFAIIASNGVKFLTNYPGYTGTVIDSAMSLNNAFDILKLSADKGVTFFGDITYQSAWGGDGNGKTLEWDGTALKESLLEGGTPGVVNSVSSSAPAPTPTPTPTPTPSPAESPAATPTPTPTLDETASSTTPLNPPLSGGTNQGKQKNNFGEVVINELVSDPADNEVEWIELYNKAGREIDLTGWWLEDGGKAKTKLEGVLAASGSGRYKVIEKPAGVLNNDGDLLVLYDGAGKIIDQAAYGNWPDGNREDNAPVAHDPASVARKIDGYNSFNDANDFISTIKPTKGASNIIQTEDEVSQEAKAKFDFSNDIYISEIFPNPVGDDTKQEFIEIYNAGQREVNLTGWSISREEDKKINLEKIATSSLIKAGEYLALFRTKSKIVLPNDSGKVKLFQPLADKPLAVVEYKNVKEGWSYNLENPITFLSSPLSTAGAGQAGGSWEWSETPTPGAGNMFKIVNRAPEVEFSLPGEALLGQPIIFDSSDTTDADGDSLKYAWDFGDGFKNSLPNPEHTFFKSGIYKVKLAVGDGQATTTAEKNLRVAASAGEIGLEEETPPLYLPLSKGENNTLWPGGTVVVNEIFPNPAGADTGGEWAELKNQGSEKVNLLNWRLENSNGKYKFKNDSWLDTENFYLLADTASRLAFKNTDDVINLYNDLDELIDRVEYTAAVQGEAYARGANGKWFWTTKASPRRENIISLAESAGVKKQELGTRGNSENYVEATLVEVKEMEISSLVKVKGAVAVEPGILGAQIFYIVGSPGMQIYNYKKDFPLLKVGDYVEVSGELAESQGELRIKTKDKNDINIVEHKPAPSAISLSCDAISEENVGQLITVTGEITSKKSYTAYLDDGNEEILVYFKKSAGLETKNLKAGQTAAITGILSRTPTGLRLLPRYQADIVKIDEAIIEPRVLGEAIESDEWAVAERDKKLELFKYLLIIAGGIIIVLAGLFIRIKKQV